MVTDFREGGHFAPPTLSSPQRVDKEVILSHELNSSEKVILIWDNTAETYNLSDIILEYDVIFDERYATR